VNKHIILSIGAAIVLGGALFAAWVLRQPPANVAVSSPPLRVAASFYPLAEFASQIGQDKVAVTNLTPAGAEPHDFDPSPQDIAALQNSKVFIYNGAGLESWVNRVLPDLQKNGVITVNASQGITLLQGISEEASASVQPSIDPALADPHFWLDPVLAQQEVQTIAHALSAADPSNRAFYEANAAAYQQKLQELDAAFRQKLSSCMQKDIVTSHAAFGYMAKRYAFTMLPIAGLSPDEEPAPKRLAQIAEFARAHSVHYIFFETLVSPRLSQTVASEIGAQTITFNPLEGLTPEELQQGKNYLTVQRENLQNLSTALSCR